MTHIANSFFHYTNEIDYLISILENDFYPRYCYENYSQLLPNYINTHISTEIAVPMVCFCDIPLDLVSEHTNEYGKYAIGLTKEWGLNNLNPVFYLNSHSIPLKYLNAIQKKLMLDKSLTDTEQLYRFELLQNFFAFIKPYSGISNKTNQKKEFYREREWRWIPEISIADEKEGIALRLLKDDEGKKENKNQLLKSKYKLKFTINDITYIVVPDNEIKKGIVSKIYHIKEKYELSDSLYLISKVISLQEIKENF
jgi:hypothetical protein